MFLILLLVSSWTFGPRISVLNDGISIGKYDDDGFTNDFEISSYITNTELKQQLNIYLRHRMITERGGGKKRWDQGDIDLSYLFNIVDNDIIKVGVGPNLGIALGGNLGGLTIQNGFHHLINARTIENGRLQDTYNGSNRFGFTFGGTVSSLINISSDFILRSGVVLNQSFGLTGLSEILLFNGLIFSHIFDTFPLYPLISITINENMYGSQDPNLSINGGYVLGKFLFMPQIEFTVNYKEFCFGWGQRWNEGGAGHAVGMFFVQFNRNWLFNR